MNLYLPLMLAFQARAEPPQERSDSASTPSDTGNCQWGDVKELLNHINDTENEPLPKFPPVEPNNLALCYETHSAWTQLYVMTLLTWEPHGVPVEGTVIDALRASQNTHVKQTEPTFVLPCSIMGIPSHYTFTSTVAPSQR